MEKVFVIPAGLELRTLLVLDTFLFLFSNVGSIIISNWLYHGGNYTLVSVISSVVSIYLAGLFT